MAFGDEPTPTKDNRAARVASVWTGTVAWWRRVGSMGMLQGLAAHAVLVPALLVGLWAGKSLLGQKQATAASDAHPRWSASADLLSESASAQGVGGQEGEVLVCAVVPHTIIPRRYRIDPITYTVQSDDNVSNIAERFGVSMETVMWANDGLEDNPDFLADGDVLTILPVSGVYHAVVKGDTLESIAQAYKAGVADITAYEGNYMQEPYAITVGRKLIVPGGRKPYKPKSVVAWSGAIPAGAKRGSGVFGWPMSGRISQGFNEYHSAVDIAALQGTTIKAADSGYVALVARNDLSYGLHVLIDHGNGYQTLYAHFSAVYVKEGQSVSKGQTLGACGSTGKSTGPHLHFELKLNGARRNPFLYLK